MPKVFISYKRGDEVQRDELEEILDKKLSYQVWYDQADIKGGEPWRQVIEEGLEQCIACVVVVTDNIFSSKWVLFEIAFAMGFGLPIIPWCPNDITPKSRNKGKELYDMLRQINFVETEGKLESELKLAKKNYVADFLNEEIAQLTLRLRVLLHLGCMYLTQNNLNDEQIQKARDCFFEFGNIINEFSWSQFWLQYSSAFSRKQKRLYNKLIIYFDELLNLFQLVSAELKSMQNSYGNIENLQSSNKVLRDKLIEIDTYIDTIYVNKRYEKLLKRIGDFIEGSVKKYTFLNDYELALEYYDKNLIPDELKIRFIPKSDLFNIDILNFLHKFRLGTRIFFLGIKHGDILNISDSDVFEVFKESFYSVNLNEFKEFILEYGSELNSQRKNLDSLMGMLKKFGHGYNTIWRYFKELDSLTSLKSTDDFRDIVKQFEVIDSHIKRHFGQDDAYDSWLRAIQQIVNKIDSGEIEKASILFKNLLTKVGSIQN